MLEKVISGGQTGADRAGLLAAINLGIPHGGYCPKGRIAEDGTVPIYFKLQETRSPDYSERTRLNVINSDATLMIFYGGLTSRGSLSTIGMVSDFRKILIELCLGDNKQEAEDYVLSTDWLTDTIKGIRVLNVAGPRESKCPGLQTIGTDVLVKLFTSLT